eukprot:gnl/MRDRNA2_/MRDRNA2_71259_c0_seq2.p1 gnl/MRDRNA2_/MRDRNA2_71259_c0~~gnl/MRDRNA2_/MRDRNA2_71259_c0_seq2.p1  ORF type:complete len:502 (+),score=90.46 gnl/MRDRNA2_/MRDRNA2_71259_c0_seq2:58-1506(+)
MTASRLVEKLVDKLNHQVWSLDSTDLDDATLGKVRRHLHMPQKTHHMGISKHYSALHMLSGYHFSARLPQPSSLPGYQPVPPLHRLVFPAYLHRGRHPSCMVVPIAAEIHGKDGGSGRHAAMDFGSAAVNAAMGSTAADERLDAAFVLDRVYESVFGGVDPPEEIMTENTISSQGSRAVGVLRLRTTDGAFAGNDVEFFEAEDAPIGRIKHGFDGEKVWIWEHNSKQRIESELDEKENVILGFWGLYALWALPNLRNKLDIQILDSVNAGKLGLGDKMKTDEICLVIKMRKSDSLGVQGVATMYQFVNTMKWLPTMALTDYCNRQKKTILRDWRPGKAVPSMLIPSTTLTTEIDQRQTRGTVRAVRPWRCGGGSAVTARAAALESALLDPLPEKAPEDILVELPDESGWEPNVEQPYIGPNYGYNDVTFNTAVSNEIEVDLHPMGQLVIRSLINGKDIGWWMLDTGASCNVMADWAADLLGC